jgi:hypothetical protein
VPANTSVGTVLLNDAQATIDVGGTMSTGTLMINAGTVEVTGDLGIADLTNA